MTRIVFVIGSLRGGGAERNLLRLAGYFASRDWDVSILVLTPGQGAAFPVPPGMRIVEGVIDLGRPVRWYRVDCFLSRLVSLRRQCVRSDPSIVVSFLDTINVLVLLALFGTGIPVVVSERVDWRRHLLGWRWRVLRRLLYPFAMRVVSVAKAAARAAQDYWPAWTCIHIPNPVQPAPRLHATAGRARRTIIGMGRLDDQKGFDLLISAFARCAARHPEWSLTILGEGPRRGALEVQCRTLGLSDRVSLPGFVDDPERWLSNADLFAFSSRYEGFPMALAEAMACGLPVVCFDCPGGPADLIRHGHDGWLVEAENVDSFANALDLLMTDASLRAHLSGNALSITDRFAPGAVFAQWETLIGSVMVEAGRPSRLRWFLRPRNRIRPDPDDDGVDGSVQWR